MENKNYDYFERYRITLHTAAGKLILGVCSVKRTDALTAEITRGNGRGIKAELDGIIRERGIHIPPKFQRLPHGEYVRIAMRYIEELEKAVKKHSEQLEVPECSWINLDDGLEPCMLSPGTNALKLVSDYAHMSFAEVRETGYLVFRLLIADAVKYNLGRTPKGIEYLNGAYEEMFKPFDRREFLSGG